MLFENSSVNLLKRRSITVEGVVALLQQLGTLLYFPSRPFIGNDIPYGDQKNNERKDVIPIFQYRVHKNPSLFMGRCFSQNMILDVFDLRTNTVGRGLAPTVTTDKPHIFGGTKAPPYKERFAPILFVRTPR